MSAETQDPNHDFGSEIQDGIFNMLFVLVDQYSQTMTRSEAVHKACDWLMSLATEVKKRVDEIDKSTQEQNDLIQNT
jgi:hypothetical protein